MFPSSLRNRLVADVRSRFERLSGLHVFRGLPHGVSVRADMTRLFPTMQIRTVFDVGANVGQSARQFRSWFPQASIHCFEPVPSSFATLVERTGPLGNVMCHELALGDISGDRSMSTEGQSVTHHVVDDSARHGSSVVVKMARLDEHCAANGITDIDYLKIDTEGHDLRVVSGAGRLVDEQRIKFIQLEAGLNQGNPAHVPLEVVLAEMTSRNYALFGVYSQAQRWPSGLVLQRCDPVFVARKHCGP